MANNNSLQVIHENLTGLIKSKAEALPEGFNQTRFIQNCMAVLQDTKDIDKANPISVARTLLKGAFLGLDFANKECYAIIYGGQCQFQTDYKGEIKLAKKYSINRIKDIYAKLVREGDFFEEYIADGQQTVNFKPIPFNNGKIIGTFAVVVFHDGSMAYETMSVEEVHRVRDNYSKQAKGQAWTKSEGEMVKKTVLRRLCKMIELDFDNAEQVEAFEDGSDFEVKDSKKAPKSVGGTSLDEKIKAMNENPVIEGEFELINQPDAFDPEGAAE